MRLTAASKPVLPAFFQRPWTWWFMIAVLVLVAFVRLRLLDFPLERDEGEYAYAGQIMLQGIPPYELAYNMKFPGTYAAYACIMAVFGETPAGIHLGILCLTTLTALMLFWLGRKILDDTAGMVAATSYAVLAASPAMLGLAGHATHFCAFFATAGLCLMWRTRQDGRWLWPAGAGLLFGVTILMKQQAVFLAVWAAAAFSVASLRAVGIPFRRRLAAVMVFGGAMILPFVLCCLLLWRAGVFSQFWFWTVDYARQYAAILPLSAAPAIFWRTFSGIMAWGGLLCLPAIPGLGLLWFDGRLRGRRVWLAGFGAASVLTICPGYYFRLHYFLLVLPAAALLGGCAVSAARHWCRQRPGTAGFSRWPAGLYILAVVLTVIHAGGIWFASSPVMAARRLYGSNPFPEAAAAARFIRENSAPEARVAVLGSEPEIYFLARRHSATGYIYTYALMEAQPFARRMQDEMIREIEAAAPEFIVCVDNSASWLGRPDSDPEIFNWWGAYHTNYALVGLADVVSITETTYAFGPEAVARQGGKLHGLGLEIYQRKKTAGLPVPP